MDDFPSYRRALRLRRCATVFAVCSLARVAHAQEPPAPITPPALLQSFEAVYPPEALAARQTADVTLLVTVGVDGAVSDLTVAQSAGEAFDAAAAAAVKRWRFSPARRGDTAVLSRIRVPFHFALPAVELPEDATPQPVNPPAPPPAAAPEAPIDVTVHGHARPPSRGTSDYQIELGHLAAVPRQTASEQLKLAPGILLTNDGGDAHAAQVFMRGFDAREGQDIEFSAAGVPVNEAGNLHGNGYADTHFIIPELVSSLRVLEGPFDPRQGNFAVAGSADYELGLAQRGLTAKQTLGSFGTKRTLLLWGPEGAATGTFTGVDLYQTDGF